MSIERIPEELDSKKGEGGDGEARVKENEIAGNSLSRNLSQLGVHRERIQLSFSCKYAGAIFNQRAGAKKDPPFVFEHRCGGGGGDGGNASTVNEQTLIFSRSKTLPGTTYLPTATNPCTRAGGACEGDDTMRDHTTAIIIARC